MKKALVVLLSGMILMSLVAYAAGTESAWFSETSESFLENSWQRWSYTPGVAFKDGEFIRITEPKSLDDGDVIYAPSSSSSPAAEVVHEVIFESIGRMSMIADERNLTGFQLVHADDGVESGDVFYLAYLEPIKGNSCWKCNSEYVCKTNTRYSVKVRIDVDDGVRVATYSIKGPSETQFVELGKVGLPERAALPSEFIHAGNGRITKIVANTSSEAQITNNDRWRSSNALYTWGGFYNGGNKFENGIYRELNLAKGVDSGVVLTGGVDKAETIWQDGAEHFVEPGVAIRFDTASGSSIPSQLSPFRLAGMHVESNASGWGLNSSGTSLKTILGDTRTTLSRVESWFQFDNSFTFNRPGEFLISGVVNIDIASGKTVDMNYSIDAAPTLDDRNGTILRLRGAGTLKANMVAKGAVTLDYSKLGTRSSAYISGSLTIDGSTKFVFPESFTAGSEFKLLCGGVLNATGADGFHEVTIGDTTESVCLVFNAANKSVTRKNVLTATISGATKWSKISWDGGAKWSANVPVELTFLEGASLTIDNTDVSLPALTVKGAEVNIKPTQTLTVSSPIAVAEGTVFTVIGSTSGTASIMAAPFKVDGVLAVQGNVSLSKQISGKGIVEKSGVGTLTLQAANEYAGGTAIVGGMVKAAAEGAMGSGLIEVGSGATFDWGGNYAHANLITIAGAGVGGNGAIINSGAACTKVCGKRLTLVANATIGGSNAIDYGNGEVIDLDGYTLTIKGTGTAFKQHLFGAKVSAGEIVVESGNFGDGSSSSCSMPVVDLVISKTATLTIPSGKTLSVKTLDYSANSATTLAGTLEIADEFVAPSIALKVAKLTFGDGMKLIPSIAGSLAATSLFTQKGSLIIDMSKYSTGSSQTVLTAHDASELKIVSIKAENGDWAFSTSGASLVAKYFSCGCARIFNWESTGTSVDFKSAEAKFHEYDGYTGSTKGSEITGTTTFNGSAFWNSWYVASSYYKAPGFVLRLAGSYAPTITANFGLALGGILQEGSNSYTIDTGSNGVTLGGDGVVTCYSAVKSVTIGGTGNVALRGRLAFNGDGSLKSAKQFNAKENSILDFVKLSSSRSTPFIDAPLVVDKTVSVWFPADVKQNTGYKICTGSLTATDADGIRTIRVGNSEFLAMLSFNSTEKTVSWASNVVNNAVISKSTKWDDIVWNTATGAYIAGAPVVITLNSDNVIINFEGTTRIPPSIRFVGAHGVALSGGSEFDNTVVTYADGAYPIDAIFYWIGKKSDKWSDEANWNFGVLPGVGDTVRFTNTVEIVANDSEAVGRLVIDRNVEVGFNLQNKLAKCEFQGLVGGKFIKRGLGTVRFANHEVDGYVVERGVVDALEGSVIFGSTALTGQLKNLTLSVSNATTYVSDKTLTTSGSIVIDCDSDMDVLVPETSGSSVSLQGSGTIVKTGHGIARIGVLVGKKVADMPYNGAVEIRDGTLSIASKLSTEYSYIDGALSGAGKFGVEKGALVLLIGSSVTDGGFCGKGTLLFKQRPDDSVGDSLKGSEWKGTVEFNGFNPFRSISPDLYGNASSTVRFTDCTGYFRAGSYSVAPRVELVKDSTDNGLEITGGYPNSKVSLASLSGSGGFYVDCDSVGAKDYEIEIDDVSVFDGSITMTAGDILLHDDVEAYIGDDSIWSAKKGYISVPKDSTLVDRGLIAGQVVSNGTVRYAGMVTDNKLEALAGYTKEDWKGTVLIDDAEFKNAKLYNGGNANSRIVIADAKGYLASQEISHSVILTNYGYTISTSSTGGKNKKVVFQKFEGDGNFGTESGNNCKDSVYKVLNIDDYTGAFKVRNGGASVMIGETSRSRGGALDVANDATIKANCEWEADSVSFGKTVKVIGRPGDAVVKIIGEDDAGDFSHVRVYPSEGAEGERVYRLVMLDRWLYVAESSSPPSADILGLNVAYGVDMTNATVYINVTNFWKGVDYMKKLLALVTIYDASSNRLDSIGGWITGNGSFVLGTTDLPRSGGTNYIYEVSINALETEYSDYENVDGNMVVDPVSHLQGNWFSENAGTFPPEATGKSGTWTWTPYSSKIAYVEDDLIKIECDAAEGQRVNFTPYENSREDIVRVEYIAGMNDGASQVGDVSTGFDDTQAAMIMDDGEGELIFQAYNPVAKEFVDVHPAKGKLDTSALHRVGITINYTAGSIQYSVDGRTMIAENGAALFPLTDEAIAKRSITNFFFRGSGVVQSANGDRYNPYLARVVSGATTNDFSTVEEAVEKAVAENSSEITLLWDATWKPVTNDVGRTFNFGGGYDVYIDSSVTNRMFTEGYVISTNGVDEGVYTVDVRKFYLAFDKNDDSATGEMLNQVYSVTNMIFNLLKCGFTKEGCDLGYWNQDQRGINPLRWGDAGEIDMRQFGLTNMTLYAFWTTAKRTITVAKADEFVYIDLVETNSVPHNGIRFHTDRSASFDVYHGSEVVIRFSTDIERRLNQTVLRYPRVIGSKDVTKAELPSVIDANSMVELTPMQQWAAERGIALSKFDASQYKRASCALNAPQMIDDGENEIKITDFSVNGDKCTFRITLNGEPFSDQSAIADIVQVSDNLMSWSSVSESAVVIDGEWVTVTTGTSGKFIKILIPKD